MNNLRRLVYQSCNTLGRISAGVKRCPGTRLHRRPGLRPEATSAVLRPCAAASASGDPTALVEQAVVDPRHIEVHVLAGDVVHLFERDGSVQRRRQRVVALAPAPVTGKRPRAPASGRTLSGLPSASSPVARVVDSCAVVDASPSAAHGGGHPPGILGPGSSASTPTTSSGRSGTSTPSGGRPEVVEPGLRCQVQRKTTVLEPLSSTRCSLCQRTARDNASASASCPTVASARGS
ncbi:MAG TPA: hypothetical protein VE823_01910 [Geodermatophilus sp.]|nr:hypothetical protein [Geodermatophilus sp.]